MTSSQSSLIAVSNLRAGDTIQLQLIVDAVSLDLGEGRAISTVAIDKILPRLASHDLSKLSSYFRALLIDTSSQDPSIFLSVAHAVCSTEAELEKLKSLQQAA